MRFLHTSDWHLGKRLHETSLAEGIRFERRVFHSQFAVADQKEGMGAFVEKRKPRFEHK